MFSELGRLKVHEWRRVFQELLLHCCGAPVHVSMIHCLKGARPQQGALTLHFSHLGYSNEEAHWVSVPVHTHRHVHVHLCPWRWALHTKLTLIWDKIPEGGGDARPHASAAVTSPPDLHSTSAIPPFPPLDQRCFYLGSERQLEVSVVI